MAENILAHHYYNFHRPTSSRSFIFIRMFFFSVVVVVAVHTCSCSCTMYVWSMNILIDSMAFELNARALEENRWGEKPEKLQHHQQLRVNNINIIELQVIWNNHQSKWWAGTIDASENRKITHDQFDYTWNLFGVVLPSSPSAVWEVRACSNSIHSALVWPSDCQSE